MTNLTERPAWRAEMESRLPTPERAAWERRTVHGLDADCADGVRSSQTAAAGLKSTRALAGSPSHNVRLYLVSWHL